MRKLMLFVLALVMATVVMAQDQEKGKSQPATKAIPPTEQGAKATPAIPSANAEKGMAKKAENMEKRDAKKSEKAIKKSAKKEAHDAKKDAKKAAKSEKHSQ